MSLAEKVSPVVAFCRAHPRASIATAAIVTLSTIFALATGGDDTEERQFHDVERGRFLVSVVEGGSLQAVDEVVVRNELEGSSRIIYIIPEGSMVKEGDLLVELDSGEADDALNLQKITYEKALADHVAAENNVVIVNSTVESTVRAAELAVQFAEMDLKKFDQIDREQQIRTADITIIKAKEELEIAQETLLNTEKLEAKGFETKNKLDQDSLAVTTKTLGLEEAESTLKMLKEYDLEKLKATYSSDHEEAIKELERVKKQGESLIAEAIADRNSAKNTLDLNKTKLEKMTGQFSATKLYAPQDGLVVYAISESRYSNETMVEEGASVRMRQELIKIPDTSNMKVKIKVHESQVGQVTEGQPAFIVLDSMPDERFRGEVSKVSILPDSQSRWGNPNLKVYTTEILLTDKLPDTVKPGVSARAEVVITQLQDALTVPIQSVTTLNGTQVCYVDKLGGPEPVPVEVGLYNNHSIEITKGLESGDRILIAPPLSADTDLSGNVLAGNEEDLELPSGRPEAKKPADQNAAKQAERPQGGAPSADQRAAMMKKFDKDGDGKLSDSEKSAMRASFGGGGKSAAKES
ncbi:MAG: efflux RND transporter periplasmic adaptor subunit [Verrucomicrobiales bacterium]|nr:efflux RND transporter periplasmic adaptor subunit [Verrucomicrobiales bacterium]